MFHDSPAVMSIFFFFLFQVGFFLFDTNSYLRLLILSQTSNIVLLSQISLMLLVDQKFDEFTHFSQKITETLQTSVFSVPEYSKVIIESAIKHLSRPLLIKRWHFEVSQCSFCSFNWIAVVHRKQN